MCVRVSALRGITVIFSPTTFGKAGSNLKIKFNFTLFKYFIFHKFQVFKIIRASFYFWFALKNSCY